MAGEDFIPDNQFVPDQGTNVAANAPAFIPDGQFKEDAPENTVDVLKGIAQGKDPYAGTPNARPRMYEKPDIQESIAGLEGLGSTVIPYGFNKLETATGLTTPENIRARQQKYPVESMAGQALGGIGLMAALPIAGAVESGLSGLGATTARVGGMAAEGGAFGAANAANDLALGDTDTNASKIISDVGLGSLIGGSLGVLSKGIEAAPSLFRSANAAKTSLEDLGENANKIVDLPEKKGISPSSIEELEQRVKDAGFSREGTALPEKNVLEDAASRIELQNPIHPLQLESLDNQSARDLYKTGMESHSKEGDALRNYEALQKNELIRKTDSAIQDISPNTKPIEDAVEGGKAAIKTFTENYETEKNALKPAFEALKKNDIGTADHLPGVISKMTDAVPGVAQMFDTAADTVKILPYKTSWGLDKSTYSAVKEAVESLKEGPITFQELANVRKGLDQNIDILSKGQGPREIMALKKSMMDYMQGVLNNSEGFLDQAKNLGIDETGLRNLYKNYAINETEREVVEKAFGASIGSPEFGAISKVKPEEISDKIFKNTATVAAAKKILSPEQFNELLANHLAEQKALVTDKGVFSSNKFGSYLKRNQDALNEAFKENPQGLQRIKDINNIMRILPDSASINPSGTAKTLWGILKAHNIGDLIGNIKEYGKHSLDHYMLTKNLNENLAGKADQVQKLNAIQKIIQKTSDNIESSIKGIFSGKGLSSEERSALSAASVFTGLSEYNKRTQKIRELASNPSSMMDNLQSSTKEMYATAPNITQSLTNSMVQSVQFLNSKIPGPQNHMPLSAEYVPTPDQRAKFNKYYNVVSDPLVSLAEIKNGNISRETIEALTATHPNLYKDMKMSLLDNFKPEKAKELPYQVKMSLSKFLGQPLDENMIPQSINSFQMAISAPQSNQRPGLKPTVGGMKELGIADRSQTRPHELAMGGE